MDIDFGEFVCDCGKNRFSIALSKFAQQHQRLQIGPQIEQILRRNLSGHDRVMDILAAKEFQEPTELSDAHPLEHIYVLVENWICFVGESGSDDFCYASFSSCVCDQSRVNAVAGNYSEVLRNLTANCHSERSKAKSKNPAKLPNTGATGFDSLTSRPLSLRPSRPCRGFPSRSI